MISAISWEGFLSGRTESAERADPVKAPGKQEAKEGEVCCREPGMQMRRATSNHRA